MHLALSLYLARRCIGRQYVDGVSRSSDCFEGTRVWGGGVPDTNLYWSPSLILSFCAKKLGYFMATFRDKGEGTPSRHKLVVTARVELFHAVPSSIPPCFISYVEDSGGGPPRDTNSPLCCPIIFVELRKASVVYFFPRQQGRGMPRVQVPTMLGCLGLSTILVRALRDKLYFIFFAAVNVLPGVSIASITLPPLRSRFVITSENDGRYMVRSTCALHGIQYFAITRLQRS